MCETAQYPGLNFALKGFWVNPRHGYSHSQLWYSSVTRGLRLLRLALVLAADAGGARFVDIGAILEGVAGAAAGRVVGEPRAALGRLRGGKRVSLL